MKLIIYLALLITLACNSVVAEESGKQIFQNHCTQCHKLPDVSSRSPKQLAMLIDIMQQVMTNRGVTPLAEADKTALLAYLQKHSLQRDISDDITPQDTFLVRCTLCHQAPDPEMLKFKQWQFVLMTMDQRMEQTGIPSLNESDREIILNYLKEHAR